MFTALAGKFFINSQSIATQSLGVGSFVRFLLVSKLRIFGSLALPFVPHTFLSAEHERLTHGWFLR